MNIFQTIFLDDSRQWDEEAQKYFVVSPKSGLDLGNSDVWAMQCFAVLLSKLVSEHAKWSCSETILETTLHPPNI